MMVVIGGVGLVVLGLAFWIICYHGDKELSIILRLAAIFSIPIGIIILCEYSFRSGEKVGAYKMMRGKYTISYIMDQDSIITDTIIELKND